MFLPNSTPSTSNKRETNANNANSSNSNSMFPLATPVHQIYSNDSPHFVAASHNSPSNNPPNFTNISSTGNNPGTASRTYKTRERLYYETDYVKSTNSPLSTSATTSAVAGNPSTLFEPFVKKNGSEDSSSKIAAEELPPTASIHEFLLPTSTSSSGNQVPLNGSPMVINGVIGSPMKLNREDSVVNNNIFVVGAGPQQMTRSITVFGFPPNCRNEILLSFQGHGSIESYDTSNGTFDGTGLNSNSGSNWIHIVYESEWSAQKALSRNGSIFQPAGVMIGVIPMQMALEKVNIAADSFMSPVKTSSKLQPSKLGLEETIFLSQTVQSSSTKTDGVKLETLPDDSSIVTKAVNYIFGW